MHNNTTIEKTDKRLARPLKVLVPLINRDIENAEEAGQMFYKAAGEKLIEARDNFEKDKSKTGRATAIEFWKWFREEKQIVYPDGRPVSETTARTWMELWEAENVRGEVFESQEEYIRSRRSPASARRGKKPSEYRDYQEPVDKVLSGINRKEQTERAANEAREYELERKLASKLIDIGFKVLSLELHPDKGGSADAMRRLNKVRATLKAAY